MFNATASPVLVQSVFFGAYWAISHPQLVETTCVERLIASTLYQVRVKMRNDIGVSDDSALSPPASTTAAVVPAAPSAIATPLDAITASDCVVEWSQGHNGGAPLTMFVVEFAIENTNSESCSRTWIPACTTSGCGTSSAVECHVDAAAMLPANGNTRKQATCTSLQSGTKYIFRVRAQNRVGLSEGSTASSIVQTVVLNSPIVVSSSPADGEDAAACVAMDSTQACATLRYAATMRQGSTRQVFSLSAGIHSTEHPETAAAGNKSVAIVFTNLPAAVLSGDNDKSTAATSLDCSEAFEICIDSSRGRVDGDPVVWFPGTIRDIHFSNWGTGGTALRVGLPVLQGNVYVAEEHVQSPVAIVNTRFNVFHGRRG